MAGTKQPRPEALDEEIIIECDGCGREEEAKRKDLVEEGWNWKEGSVHGLFNIQAAECPDCEDVDREKVFQEKADQVKKVHGAA